MQPLLSPYAKQKPKTQLIKWRFLDQEAAVKDGLAVRENIVLKTLLPGAIVLSLITSSRYPGSPTASGLGNQTSSRGLLFAVSKIIFSHFSQIVVRISTQRKSALDDLGSPASNDNFTILSPNFVSSACFRMNLQPALVWALWCWNKCFLDCPKIVHEFSFRACLPVPSCKHRIFAVITQPAASSCQHDSCTTS